jgi:uncharacterized membrane protein
LNLHGRICLEGLLFFGAGACLFVYILAPILNQWIVKIPGRLRGILCVLFLLCFCADLLYSSLHPNTGEGITQEIRRTAERSVTEYDIGMDPSLSGSAGAESVRRIPVFSDPI